MDALTTREVARRTGLTSRALRFYETRGLVRPTRTYNGTRFYGPGELERLARVLALKGAGLTLAQIAGVLTGRAPDLAALVDAQLAALTARHADTEAALVRLRAVKAALADGRAPGAEELCAIINQGGRTMTDQDWKKVADRYFTPEEQARWAAKWANVPPGFDPQAYNRQWANLGTRIGADLPMDPTSDKAAAYLAEWNTLLIPFNLVADTRMKTETVALYDRIDEWKGEATPPFSSAVWAFIKAAAVAQRAGTGSGPE